LSAYAHSVHLLGILQYRLDLLLTLAVPETGNWISL
jgi:hypothetical protein